MLSSSTISRITVIIQNLLVIFYYLRNNWKKLTPTSFSLFNEWPLTFINSVSNSWCYSNVMEPNDVEAIKYVLFMLLHKNLPRFREQCHSRNICFSPVSSHQRKRELWERDRFKPCEICYKLIILWQKWPTSYKQRFSILILIVGFKSLQRSIS